MLTPSDYLQLRSELVQRDIFLTETLVTGFGYLIQTTFKGALHCEDGPALIEYYKDQKRTNTSSQNTILIILDTKLKAVICRLWRAITSYNFL